MKHGFVYVLGNDSMPGRYKIGFTCNSPFERAEQLSASTGVPVEFTVLAFICVPSPQIHERRLHAQFGKYRLNESREFFCCKLSRIVDAMQALGADHGHFVDIESAPWIYLEEPELFSRKTQAVAEVGAIR